MEISRLEGLRCLVLGGGGFLGSNLCNALAAAGARIQAFGRNRLFPEQCDSRVEWTMGDFRDSLSLARAVEGQEIVYHLISASTPENSNHDPASDVEANITATVRLLDLCRGSGVRKVVFASSGGTVYGIPRRLPITEDAGTFPISSYGIGKLTIEKYLHLYRHLHGLDYVALRISNPYGRFQAAHRRQGVVAAMMRQALSGKPLEIWGNGEVVRDFLHVDDVIEAMLLATSYEGEQRIMNISSGAGLSINDIVRDIEAVMGKSLEKRYLPGRSADVPVNILDSALARAELGWLPRTDWMTGLASTLEWMQSGQAARLR
jgi:UDP-glucose 4-epimerase